MSANNGYDDPDALPQSEKTQDSDDDDYRADDVDNVVQLSIS
jgi:hypothetical protein